MPDLGRDDLQSWLVVVDPDKVYNVMALFGYDRIQFTYQTDNFTESKSATYSSTSILGRSEPVRGYLGSSPRAVSLQLSIPPDGDGGEAPTLTASDTAVSFDSSDPTFGPQTPTSVKQPKPGTAAAFFARKLQVIDFIRSLVYPLYGTNTQQIVYPPPRVLLLHGQWFSMIGILTNYSMTHRAPWTGQGLMAPYFTDVSITIEECDQPYSFRDVYSGSLQKSAKNNYQSSPTAASSLVGGQ